MGDKVQHQFPEELNHIYASISQHDVEQFYASYQLWWTYQQIAALQEQIGHLRLQFSENAQRLQELQPPAVAFATLARLQANGVNDIDLLDRMLERGEEWLDLTMQRLDYCEQLDFIHDNYTQWCEHALEGAYDWIDSMRDTYADTEPRPVVRPGGNEVQVEATEELLLRKLTSEDDEEDELSSKEITLKRPAVSPLPTAEVSPFESSRDDGLDTPLIAPDQGEGPQEELPSQEQEMAVPAVTDRASMDTSFVSSEQAGEDEYIEFAPLIETRMEEAEGPMGASLQETFPIIEELITRQEDALPSETHIEDAPSEVVIEQAGEEVETVPPSLPTAGTTRIETSLVSAKHEEPGSSEGGGTHNEAKVQLKRLEYRKRHMQQQGAKPQRRRKFWRHLLADFWP